jgi:hypothetical protein
MTVVFTVAVWACGVGRAHDTQIEIHAEDEKARFHERVNKGRMHMYVCTYVRTKKSQEKSGKTERCMCVYVCTHVSHA